MVRAVDARLAPVVNDRFSRIPLYRCEALPIPALELVTRLQTRRVQMLAYASVHRAMTVEHQVPIRLSE